MQHKAPLLSLGLISASALAYEILLMRLFSIIQWHHFAYMIISLALLGYGISGTLVSLLQDGLKRWFYISYPLFLLLFSISSVVCFMLAQSIPFNPEAIVWDLQQLWYLLALFLLLAIPFLLVASAICLTFLYYPEQIAKIYAVDLFGAGVGSISIIILLFYFFPLTALLIICLTGLTATVIALYELYPRPASASQGKVYIFLMALIVISGILLIATLHSSSLNISPYKDMAKQLNISGSRIIEQQSSPLGLLSVLQSSRIPLRHAPGLSLYNTQEPPEQLGLFTDSSNMTVISRYPGQQEKLSYLTQMTSALPYHLNSIEQLLIVGAGGGSDILQAMVYNTAQIDAVELNPQIIDLLCRQFADYSGNICAQEQVNIYPQDIRAFLSHSQKNNKIKHYDLIQLSLMDSFSASASGLYALHESYLYTVEALQIYLQHLNQDGYLAISRWVKTPPRDAIKIFATAVETLEQLSVQDAAQHLILIRGWQTATLLVKKTPFKKTEITRLKQFCHSRGFDVVWYPGIKAAEVNQFNHFREAYFYQAANALLGKSDSQTKSQFLQNYKYNVTPASDDKPFFHHFFKWSVFTELFSLREQGGLALVEMAYIVLLATLLLAVISSIILILLPLLVFHLRSKNNREFSWSVRSRIQIFLYFFCIGLAFLFIEIAMMQKFILFLQHPVYAIPVVLSAFMIFAGLGSALTAPLLKRLSRQQLLLLAISGIAAISIFYSFFLGMLFNNTAASAISLKVVISLLLIAPLALCMGMPFPIALGQLGSEKQAYIPWAWGINGCASVISAVLASLLAIHFGFTLVILFAVSLYILCLLIFF